MSMAPEDLSRQLSKAGGKRTAAHDRWIASAFGVVLPDDAQASSNGDAAKKAPAKKTSEESYKKLEPRFAAVRTKRGMVAFGGLFKQLDTQQKEFEAAVASYQAQIGGADGPGAAGLVQAVADKIAAAEKTHADIQELEDLNTEREQFDNGTRNMLDKKVKDSTNPPAWVTTAGAAAAKAVNDFNAGKAAAEKKSALAAFKIALPAYEQAVAKMDQVHLRIESLRPSVDAALKDMTAGNPATRKLRQELKIARDAYDQGIAAATLSGAHTLAKEVKDNLGAISLEELGGAGASAKDKRRALMAMGSDPAKQKQMLAALAGSDAGAKEVDAIVGTLGAKVKDKGEQAFLKEALKARFGLDNLEGDLTTKALPRLYAVMKDLPEAHTRDNPRLKKITRTRKSGEGASWYKADGDLIELNLGKTGNVARTSGGVFGFRDKRNEEQLNKQTVKSFDTTALHEIGHAVDARFTFMSKRVGDKKFGGWGFTTIDKVAEVAGSNKLLGEAQAFFDQFQAYGKKFLTDYLTQALAGQEMVVRAAAAADPTKLGQDPAVAEAIKLRDANKKADGKVPELTQIKLIDKAMKKCAVKDDSQKELMKQVVTRILRVGGNATDVTDSVKRLVEACKVSAPAKTPDWDAMVEHKAVDWCRNVRLNGGHDGLWAKGDDVKTYAVGSTVYQQSYRDKWTTYDAGARANAVSTYQFRAPGEWFAEIYAAYYQKVISPTHPYAVWFKTEVHERKT